MTPGLRALARRFLPHSLRAKIRKIIPSRASERGPQAIHFSGDFPTWEEAPCAGWDQPWILERVRASLSQVRRGEAAYERDGVAFHRSEHRWPLLASLLQIAASRGGRLHVLDFGGSLGSTYFQCRPQLLGIGELRWSVIDQPTFVECGRAEFQTDDLRFYFDADACLAEVRPDVLLLSGALQYFPEPYDVLCRLLDLELPHVILDRTPLLAGSRDRLTVQSVPAEIYGRPTQLPAWFLARQRLEASLTTNHDLLTEFDALDEDAHLGEGESAHYVGQHWQRRPVARTRPAPQPAIRRFRVGIVAPNQSEHVGGGHTYEQNLLGGLLAQISKSSHDFVLLGTHGCAASKLPDNCVWQTLPVALGPERSPSRERQRRTEFLRGHGIGLVVHLNPFSVLDSDVPYFAVVWDLQHRLQPYFPEVSASGEWEARQRHFADMLPRSSCVVTGTQVGKRQIETLFSIPPERVVVLPMATPDDARAHRAIKGRETADRLNLKERFVLYPAQFWPHKNHITLLRAIRILNDRHGVRPLLAFTGSDQGNVSHVLARAHAMGVGDQVRYFGFMPRADLLDLYGVAAALAYPSLFGPDNIPPLEAFALGCPVIAAQSEGAQEQFGDAARLVDPMDAEQWASALFSVMEHQEERARLVAAGKDRAARWTNADVAAGLLREIDRFATIRALWS